MTIQMSASIDLLQTLARRSLGHGVWATQLKRSDLRAVCRDFLRPVLFHLFSQRLDLLRLKIGRGLECGQRRHRPLGWIWSFVAGRQALVEARDGNCQPVIARSD